MAQVIKDDLGGGGSPEVIKKIITPVTGNNSNSGNNSGNSNSGSNNQYFYIGDGKKVSPDATTPVIKNPWNPIDNGTITPYPIDRTPLPGNPVVGDGMNITMSEIPNIISKLRSCETKVREIWGELLNTYIAQIENSWAGPDASAYVEKVRSYETKVNNSAQALSLLADTYQKVLTSSQETQQRVTTAVNNF